MKTVTIDNLEVCLYDYMDIKIKEICGSDLLFHKIKEEFVDINDLRCAKKWELVDLGLTPLISEMILISI